MKTHTSTGAASARISESENGGAVRAAVFVGARKIGLTQCSFPLAQLATVFLAATLAGCGGAPAGTTRALDDIALDETAVTQDEPAEEAAADITTGSAPGEIGADVLLLQAAGTADLPVATAPTVNFISSTATSSAPITTSSLRSSVRSASVTDGGRSTVASNENLQSGNVTVSWDPPLQNADGTSIADLAGYRVYQGNQESLTIVQELNETGAGERRLTQIVGVTADNSCFAVTAFDTSANESSLGNVVCKDIIVAAPPTNNLAPALISVTQVSSNDGLADISLRWQPPASSSASAGSQVELYSLYHGNQSQLFKISEITEAEALNGSVRSSVVSGIGGEQACFALTARYTDGSETSLGEITCVALVHSAAPQPGNELRPYNVTVELLAGDSAQVSWNKPNTVVSSADATGIDRYDLYQGSASQVFKVDEINETGEAGNRRSTIVTNAFTGSDCFALTATDESRRQSALSTIVCAGSPTTSFPSSPSPTTPSSPEQPRTAAAPGVTDLVAQETSAGSVAISWDAPTLVVVGQPIANLSGYNVYQGSETQLFKVAELSHSASTVRQQIQRTGVDGSNACFAITAFDNNGFESPLSSIVCATISGTSVLPQFGIVPPTEITTSALGGSTTVTLSWLASGAAITGAADPNVHLYNIYQGDHDRLFKVREVDEEHDADPHTQITFTGVAPGAACFAITAQYRDLRESRLSDIVCRDD